MEVISPTSTQQISKLARKLAQAMHSASPLLSLVARVLVLAISKTQRTVVLRMTVLMVSERSRVE